MVSKSISRRGFTTACRLFCVAAVYSRPMVNRLMQMMPLMVLGIPGRKEARISSTMVPKSKIVGT